MSISVCIEGLVAEGRIGKGLATEAERHYTMAYNRLKRTMGPSAAASEASELAIKQIELGLRRKQRLELLQIDAQTRIERDAREIYDGGKHKDGPISGKALRAHLVRDQRGFGINNVELHARVLAQDARQMQYDLLMRYRKGLPGQLRYRAEELDLAKALHGEAVDNVNVREIAEAVKATQEMQRSRFNAAGGNIAKLENYGVKHSWDPYRTGNLTPDQFADRLIPELDRAKMIDWDTGEALDDEGLRALLRDQIYETIVSDGASKRTPGTQGVGALANRWAEHRVLHFKDAESWLRINDELGTGSLFNALMHQTEAMASATAKMEILGPNPAATVKWMRDLADSEAKTKGTSADRVKAGIRDYEIEKVWQELSGANSRAVRPNLALFASTLRNWQVATKLGSAAITSLSDIATRRVTRAFAGMPHTMLIGQMAKQLTPLAGAADREFVRRRLLISDEFAGRMAGLGRMHLEDAYAGRLAPQGANLHSVLESANEVSARMADFVMRKSGLNAITIAGRETAAMEFVANLSHWSGKDFAALDPFFADQLTRNGIDAAKWASLRETPLQRWKGVDWLLPENVADRALGETLKRMQLMHVDLAVPTADLLMTALIKNERPGTVKAELGKAGFQFKGFPLTVMVQHSAAMMAMSGGWSRARYAASFLGATTFMGMVTAQLAQLSNGGDPLPIDEKLVQRGIQKGGGLGVFGDAIMLSRNEYGQTVGDLTLGPSWSSAQNLADFGWAMGESGAAAISGDDEAIEAAAKARGTSTRNLLKRETPVLGMWYTKKAYELLFVDTVSEWSRGEPMSDSYARVERYAQERGAGYWAPPGAFTGSGNPARPIDWGNALGRPAAPENVARVEEAAAKAAEAE